MSIPTFAPCAPSCSIFSASSASPCASAKAYAPEFGPISQKRPQDTDPLPIAVLQWGSGELQSHPVFAPYPRPPSNLLPGDWMGVSPSLSDPLKRFRDWPILVEYIDGRRVRLARDIGYRIAGGRLAGLLSTVRAGFVFDWASVPRIFWRIFPPAGDGHNLYGVAALWHDWACAHRELGGAVCTRAEADALFLEIMLYVGVHPWIARLMYAAVRVGGWPLWNRRTRSIQEQLA
jgi:hypothetical protein